MDRMESDKALSKWKEARLSNVKLTEEEEKELERHFKWGYLRSIRDYEGK